MSEPRSASRQLAGAIGEQPTAHQRPGAQEPQFLAPGPQPQPMASGPQPPGAGQPAATDPAAASGRQPPASGKKPPMDLPDPWA